MGRSATKKLVCFYALILLATKSLAGSGTICVSRAEDNGALNIRPAHIRFDGQRALSVFGGDHKCIKAASGHHIVEAYSSDPYDPDIKNENAWRSQPIEITVTGSKKIKLIVKPISKGPTYTGPWSVEVSN